MTPTPVEPIARLEFPGGKLFTAAPADLLRELVDAIVNAANGHLAHGGGVAGAIARAAGAEMVKEGDALVARDGPIPTGSAVVTTAGKLPFKGVIHAVGSRQGEGDEHEKLKNALVSAFRLAEDRGWTSVAFPAVSSGIFAVPPDVCASAYVAAVRQFWAEMPDARLSVIRLCVFPGPVADAVRAEMTKG
jgi:O-acetyl-ADP-ribose deacetylase (regulator of RNase III)